MERLRLNTAVVSHTDVARLQRELNALNDFFTSARARQTGSTMQLPKLTRLLNQLALDNNVNLIDENHRSQLAKVLAELYEKAPSVHISFASEPSPKTTELLITWMRANIHPHLLMQVGLQPSIAAGCYLRTPNKVFDMSLRSAIKRNEPYLAKLIAGAASGR